MQHPRPSRVPLVPAPASMPVPVPVPGPGSSQSRLNLITANSADSFLTFLGTPARSPSPRTPPGIAHLHRALQQQQQRQAQAQLQYAYYQRQHVQSQEFVAATYTTSAQVPQDAQRRPVMKRGHSNTSSGRGSQPASASPSPTKTYAHAQTRPGLSKSRNNSYYGTK